MQLLLPLIFFGLSGIVMGFLRLRGTRMAFLWLLPAFITLVCWLIILILPLPSPTNVFKLPGLFSLMSGNGLTFSIDETSWGFIFLVVSLVLVYFLTLLIRLEQEKRTWLWIGWLILSMVAILSFTAGNLTTLIVTWVLFDLLDFLFTYFILKTDPIHSSLGKFISSPVISIILLMLAAVFLPSDSLQWLPKPLEPGAYFLLFFAALFRTGLLPFPIEKVNEENRVSFAFLRRILRLLSGFSLMSFLPIHYLTDLSQGLLSAIFLTFSISFLFLALNRRSPAISPFLNCITCLGCIAVFSGTPISLLGWAGVAVLGAGILHFYTYRSGRLNFFVWLGILSLSGLPYSISSFALVGLGSATSWYWLPAGLPVYALLLCNLVGSLQLPTAEKKSTEGLFLVVYSFGLFLLALSPFAILVKNRALAANALRYWWSGGVILVIGLLFYWFSKRIHINEKLLNKIKDRIIQSISFTTFSWLKNIWQGFVWIFSGITQFINQLLNGEGGIIWAMVVLALLVSLISVGRA